jgi:hypothetical protein
VLVLTFEENVPGKWVGRDVVDHGTAVEEKESMVDGGRDVGDIVVPLTDGAITRN